MLEKAFQFDIRVNATPHWKNIEPLRVVVLNSVEVTFNDKNLGSTVSMIVSELLENAIKYGEWLRIRSPYLRVHVYGNREWINVSVVNPMLKSSQHYNKLVHILKDIEHFPNSRDAYFTRMHTIAEEASDHDKKSQMGLVRIIYEGPCTIRTRFIQNSMLEVKATLNVPKRDLLSSDLKT